MSVSLTVYLVSADIERMRQFYEEGLGIKGARQQGNWLPFTVKEAVFALHGAVPGDDLQGVSYSFGVDDIDATVARLQAQGAKVLRGVADEAFGRMATLQDPEGRTFEVVNYEI